MEVNPVMPGEGFPCDLINLELGIRFQSFQELKSNEQFYELDPSRSSKISKLPH